MEEKITRLRCNCPYLTHLDISYQNLDISKVKILSHILHKNTKLISLNLEGNNITDIGATHISNMLKVNTTLTKLNLNNNKIKDKGARELGRVIIERKTPIKLSLIKHFIVTGCYDNTVYHIINSPKK